MGDPLRFFPRQWLAIAAALAAEGHTALPFRRIVPALAQQMRALAQLALIARDAGGVARIDGQHEAIKETAPGGGRSPAVRLATAQRPGAVAGAVLRHRRAGRQRRHHHPAPPPAVAAGSRAGPLALRPPGR